MRPRIIQNPRMLICMLVKIHACLHLYVYFWKLCAVGGAGGGGAVLALLISYCYKPGGPGRGDSPTQGAGGKWVAAQ
jgi:hypothetical protein